MSSRHRLLWFPALAWVAAIGLSATADTIVIDSFDYPDSNAAGKAWTPVLDLLRVSEMPAVTVVERVAGRALRLPCPFSRDLQRSLYHLDRKLDLSNAARIEFDLYIDQPEAVGQFMLYFISGSGCYRGSAGGGRTGWHRVRLNKASFKPEGTPDGWDSISALRFSPWKGAAVNTYCLVDNLVARTAGNVAVVIGTHSARERPKEAKSVYSCAERVASLLDSAGVMAATMEDEDVARGGLTGKKVAILPYNPRLSAPEGEALKRFVNDGGKVITFYILPDPLPDLLGVRKRNWVRKQRDRQFLDLDFGNSGILGMPQRVRQDSGCIQAFEPAAKNARVIGRWVDGQGQSQPQSGVILSDAGAVMSHTLLPGDDARKRRLLVALVGHFCPSAWAEAAGAAIQRAAEVGPFMELSELTVALQNQTKGHPRETEVQTAVAQATTFLTQGAAHMQAQRWIKTMAAAEAAREHLVEAYLSAQVPMEGEWRAVSNHPGTGGEPGGWEESARVLGECGFNAVLPDMCWGGVAHYDSAVLPTSETFRTHGDQLAQCVAACHAHGVQVHAWKVCWNLGNRAPREFVERMRAEGRLQVTDKGETRDWLCPSHPANLRLETEAMLEMARNYDVDGLMFDYIRYGDHHVCYCPGCKERFQRETGQDVKTWPDQVLRGTLRDAYIDWRCEQITRLVRAVSRGAHAIKPYIRISAAVFARYPNCRERVGQDWVAWVKGGLLDFVIPMDSADSGGAICAMVKRQIEQIGARVPVCP
ncbi:MAG: family 10 glycosylhydrolase, partial [Lentisphaerae bacterium]|nr:family 10 glycosylhydrolase [Lentisphaerota bacterium]